MTFEPGKFYSKPLFQNGTGWLVCHRVHPTSEGHMEGASCGVDVDGVVLGRGAMWMSFPVESNHYVEVPEAYVPLFVLRALLGEVARVAEAGYPEFPHTIFIPAAE